MSRRVSEGYCDTIVSSEREPYTIMTTVIFSERETYAMGRRHYNPSSGRQVLRRT